MSKYNFQAYSPSLDRACGHMHHTKERASRCAEHLGWEDAVIKKVVPNTFKRHNVPDYIDMLYDNSSTCEMSIKVLFNASNTIEMSDASEKICNLLMNNTKSVVKVDVDYVKWLGSQQGYSGMPCPANTTEK